MKDFDTLFENFALAARQNGATIDVITRASWLPAFECRLPFALPSLFHSFLYSYSFASITMGSIALFDNAGTSGENELSVAVFRDRVIAEAAFSKYYLPIGRPLDGSNDPICLKLHREKCFDCPIVRLDHEELVRFQSFYEVKLIAPSFESYLKSAAEISTRVRNQ